MSDMKEKTKFSGMAVVRYGARKGTWGNKQINNNNPDLQDVSQENLVKVSQAYMSRCMHCS